MSRTYMASLGGGIRHRDDFCSSPKTVIIQQPRLIRPPCHGSIFNKIDVSTYKLPKQCPISSSGSRFHWHCHGRERGNVAACSDLTIQKLTACNAVISLETADREAKHDTEMQKRPDVTISSENRLLNRETEIPHCAPQWLTT